MQVKWIKVCTDLFDDEKIVLIESMPDAYAIVTVWFKLLCLAGKQNNGGVFVLNDKIPYTDKMLATLFRMNESTVSLAISTFEQFGMIEIIDGVITIPNWEKHQNIEGMDKIREQNRIRKQKQREKNKIPQFCDSPVTVTQCHATEEDKEEDKDLKNKNKNNKKKSSYSSAFVTILDDISDDELRSLYYEFIDMRKSIKSPITSERALKMLINKVNELEPNDIGRQKKMLENAIVNNWKSVYPLKEDTKLETNASYDIDAYQERALHSDLTYKRKDKK